jgi:ubiquinol-cytochrome c reductase iron-sulfur subunit
MSAGSLDKSGVDEDRRRFLTAGATVVGAVGVITAAVPFLASLQPSEKAKTAGAPVEVDISKIAPGMRLTVMWRGKPVWILRRTPEMLDNLPLLNDKLVDPLSKNQDQQPSYADNLYRSIKPEYLVLIGICTHLGCSPTYRPDVAPEDLGPEWVGGFFCPCHGSRFDLAGRVYEGVPAPANLVVPPYHYLTDTSLIIGEDPKKEAA